MERLSVLLGALTASGIGLLLFQSAVALLLGIMGALGGYLFHKFLKPRLDRLFSKKK